MSHPAKLRTDPSAIARRQTTTDGNFNKGLLFLTNQRECKSKQTDSHKDLLPIEIPEEN